MADEIKKGMIQYTSRDYQSILDDFYDLVPKLTDLWNPESDSDPGVVLAKYLASIADMLGVNLDWLANEVYAPSVTQRKNAEKIFGLIGYDLGWYTAAKTEVTFTNNSTTGNDIELDFGFNGTNFATLYASTDITSNDASIVYNILPLTSSYSSSESRSSRSTVASDCNIFATSDTVTLSYGESVTRVAVEGELRSQSVSVATVKKNNYIINLASQHIDTTCVWLKSTNSTSSTSSTSSVRWIQVSNVADFNEPEPRFAVSYDNYGNARIQVSNYLNELDNFANQTLTVYWLECKGILGSISENVLQSFTPATTTLSSDTESAITISNLSNIKEFPHTYTVTGKSPETAKQAYQNSRNYINTWDSLITLPDYNRFLNREAGVDCGLVLDCQKALEINLAIYNDSSLTDSQKAKMYITTGDFPTDDTEYENEVKTINWATALNLDEEPTTDSLFQTNFQRYTAMCFAIHNDFEDSEYGTSIERTAQISRNSKFIQYKPPISFINAINDDFKPLKAMTVDIQFGYVRVFPWYVVGTIYPKTPVSSDVASNLIKKVKEALALYFSPANRSFGQKPTIMEVVDVIEGADDNIKYFDAGSLSNTVINWGEVQTRTGVKVIVNYDIEYFNPISFARYKDVGNSFNNLQIAPSYIV